LAKKPLVIGFVVRDYIMKRFVAFWGLDKQHRLEAAVEAFSRILLGVVGAERQSDSQSNEGDSWS
jgi:hypothetical protein